MSLAPHATGARRSRRRRPDRAIHIRVAAAPSTLLRPEGRAPVQPYDCQRCFARAGAGYDASVHVVKSSTLGAFAKMSADRRSLPPRAELKPC